MQRFLIAAALVSAAHAPLPASAASDNDPVVLEASDAYRDRDRSRLAAARASLIAQQHPLAMWAEYWELNNRLIQAQPEEVDAFFARWPYTYVEDRMRNDWLLELGRRRDWPRVIKNWARFRMRDDREAACFMWLARLTQGENVALEARAAWADQRDADEGCSQLGAALNKEDELPSAAVWRKLRGAVGAGQLRYAKQLAALIGKDVAADITEVIDAPTRVLKRQKRSIGSNGLHLAALAIVRLADTDTQAAARHLEGRWRSLLPPSVATWAWASIARQSAFDLDPKACDYFERAWEAFDAAEHVGVDPEQRFDNPADRALQIPKGHLPDWSDDVLAWQVRAALRVATSDNPDTALVLRRWRQVLQAIEAMSPNARADASWAYWRARAWLALPPEQVAATEILDALLEAPPAAGLTPTASEPAYQARATDGARPSAPLSLIERDPNGGSSENPSTPARAEPQAKPSSFNPGPIRNTHLSARRLLATIAGTHHFYSLLAAEELGRPTIPPSPPSPLTPEERNASRATPGLTRAMLLFKLGLRTEAVKEWNYTTGFGRLESDSEGPTAARPLTDRQLLAAAQWACEQEIWDRCIQAADRTRDEIDLSLRFPTPFRSVVSASTQTAKLDTAYVYGLIRQESRFILEARSSVGASGLMQVMPGTAKWTAQKLGLAYNKNNIHDLEFNIKLGSGFLRMTLNNFGGSQALAAAAYNAGPTRVRRWRENATIDAAAWVEGIPFSETRDYVKRLLSNAWAYQFVLTGQTSPLRTRLGERIGPNEPTSLVQDPDLP